MAQNICTLTIHSGEKKIMFEKPHALHRIFFSIRVMARSDMWYETKISFDGPRFNPYYMINGPVKYFEAAGADIFQGDIWAKNVSDINLTYATTEILH